MTNFFIYLVLFSGYVGYATAVNCTAMPDGDYEVGCRSFVKCSGGNATIVECIEGMVYNNNNNTGACDNITNVPPPCSILTDCSAIADGRYADQDYGCKTFYSCKDNVFHGRNFCPTGLVFHERLDLCNWQEAVPPPCGTLIGK